MPSAERTPDLSVLRVAGEKLKANVADAVTDLAVSWSVGTVAELSIALVDPDGRLARKDIVATGTKIVWGDSKWTVGSVDRDYTGWGVRTTTRARSRLAKALRDAKRTKAEKNRTPAEWIGARVKDAGGTATVQTSPKWKVITQDNDQTTLDAIAAVASESNMAWVEFDERMYVGTPWWAYQGGPGLPTWPLTWQRKDGSDVVDLSTVLSDDDREQSGVLTVTVPQPLGTRLRPWHRIRLTGTNGDDDGLWLVTSVDVTVDGTTPVTVQAHRPRKTSPQAGSSAQDTTTAAGADLATASAKARTAVEAALSQVGKPYSYAASPPSSWDCSKLTAWAWGQAGVTLTAYSYAQRDQTTPVARSAMIPGDLVFYFQGNTHHVAMYIGGGQIVEATPSAGVRVTAESNSWTNANYTSSGRVKGA